MPSVTPLLTFASLAHELHPLLLAQNFVHVNHSTPVMYSSAHMHVPTYV